MATSRNEYGAPQLSRPAPPARTVDLLRARPEASSVTLRGRLPTPGPRRRSTQSLRTINSLETSGLDGGSSGRLMVFAMQHLLEETMQCVE